MLQFILSCLVVLTFCSFASAQAKNSRFTAAGIDDEATVKNFFAKFQKAVYDDNKEAVAALVTFPVRASLPTGKNNRRSLRSIETKAAFLNAYEQIFTQDYKQFIADAKFEDLWARDTGVATPGGEVWMGAICKDKNCKKPEIKIITLNGLTDKTAQK